MSDRHDDPTMPLRPAANKEDDAQQPLSSRRDALQWVGAGLAVAPAMLAAGCATAQTGQARSRCSRDSRAAGATGADGTSNAAGRRARSAHRVPEAAVSKAAAAAARLGIAHDAKARSRREKLCWFEPSRRTQSLDHRG
jgi:hypothetical protein